MPTQSLASLALDLRSRLRPGDPAPARIAPAGGPCRPDCEICSGYGWIRLDAEVGDPMFGKLQLCPNAQLVRDYSRCGLDALDRDLTWQSIEDVQGSNAVIASQVARDVLAAGRGWVYLWGHSGLAKSAILKIAVAEALRLGRESAYVQAAEILDDLRSAFDSASPSEAARSRFEYWSSIPVLAIDELDKISESAWVRQVRFALLDKRYESAARGRSVTFIASQTEPERLPEELSSRILDGRFQVVRLLGSDYRPTFWWQKD